MSVSSVVEAPPEKQTAIVLRPYQLDAITAIEDADQRGQRRPLVVLPTGTGKTVVFSELIRRRPGRALVLVHRQELLDQTREKLACIAPDLAVGIVKAAQDEHDAAVVLASVQTLSRETRLRRVVDDFDTIVVDEAHHVLADSYRRVLDHLGETALVVGFTATPYRGDGDTLAEVFPEIVYSKPILAMIQDGYLSDLRALRVTLGVDFNSLHTRGGDFIDAECAGLLRAGNAAELVATAYVTHAKDRRGLVFVPTVELAQDFAEALTARGIMAESVSGDTSRADRRDLLARFRDGAVQVVTNCAVLTEGFDEPVVDCIVVARPTKSKPLFVQQIGRGLRRFPGKADCLVIDVAGATARHDLVTLASVFELPEARLRSGSSVLDATAAYQHECELVQAREADAAELVARTVNLFQVRPLNWIAVSPEHFVLAVGDRGMLHVQLQGDGWRAYLHRLDGGRVGIAERLDRDYTIGAAEDFARSLGVAPLVARDAPWRNGLATDKQRAALKKLQVSPPPDVTRGEASDLIAAAVARRSTW